MKNIQDYNTYVINLKRRPERLKHAVAEMHYMGWNYKVFEAIDTNSYEGCLLSHKEIAKKLLESNDDYVVVFEDDLFFMPYAKDFLMALNSELQNKECNIINLGPAFHRPINKVVGNFFDITDLPPRDLNKHRGIYGTVGLIYNKVVAKKIIDFYDDPNPNNKQIPIDVLLDTFVYPEGKAYTPISPLVTQRPVFSDINLTNDNNHYVMTYNWNLYTPHKLSSHFLDFEYCRKIRK